LRARLRHALEHSAHYLPAQGPLEVFVHHNTLHAYQHLPFHRGVAAAATKLGVQGYLAEEKYREALSRGRILESDLAAVVAEASFVATPVAPGFPTERMVAQLVTRHCIAAQTPAALHWQIVEKGAASGFAAEVSSGSKQAIITATDLWLTPRLAGASGIDEGSKLFRLADGAVAADEDVARQIVGVPEFLTPAAELAALLGTRARPEAFAARHEAVAVRSLWTACVDACRHFDGTESRARAPGFHREALLACGDEDTNELVHATLIPLCGVFLDRGQSHWSMPDRERGFFSAWMSVMLAGRSIRPGWLAQLGARLRGYQGRQADAEEVVLELLVELGVEAGECERFIEHTLLQLPGFAGMFARLEQAPGPIGRSRARVALIDFLAVRLVLDLFAFQDIGKRLGHRAPVAELRRFCAGLPRIARASTRGPHDTAWPLFMLAQHAGVAAPTIRAARREHIDAVVGLLDRLDDTARQVLWHEAYERRYRTQLLDAVAANLEHDDVVVAPSTPPRFQVMFCIDDRFESSRRHLEELSGACETYGTAGFFGLAIAYQGIDDPSTFPLCPVVVTPQHRIDEEPLTQQWDLAALRKQRLRGWGRATTLWSRMSRSLVLGMLVSIAAGALAVVPLVMSVFWPRTAGRLRLALRRWLLPEPRTRLTPARLGAEDMAASELYAGFSFDEEALRVGNLLENIGMTRRFARVVAVLGHDSSSANNPYFPAYSCGACGGRSGGPNARLYASMANQPEVRERLAARGISIPADTVFVGGVYDTCSDRVRLFDSEELAPELQTELVELRKLLLEMGRRNAHERCRRFESAPAHPSPEQARDHVEGRALDLSQARPELGHATNAACVVGRRELSQGLFLDRRAFLVSYDPSIDASGAVLERTLAAVGPVGAGINLEYFFSTVDGERLGSGTKLPHNVTGLFGLMNGAGSDLRTGLPKQMTEIHEPVRLHLIVEATPEMLTQVCERQPAVAELVRNEWVRLAAVHPDTREIYTFDARRGFELYTPQNPILPSVSRSRDWYTGHADFLPPARVVSAVPRHA
jgi:uncharacterized protein YbcC (UPF0753/DUF2309 family)